MVGDTIALWTRDGQRLGRLEFVAERIDPRSGRTLMTVNLVGVHPRPLWRRLLS